MKAFTEEQKIIRRKAKRIERARVLLYELIHDIKYCPSIHTMHKEWMEEDIEKILEYIKNDDKEENQYNHDNYNG